MNPINQQQERRITGKDTIPSSANNLLANGTVTTDTANTDHLVYSGTDNLGTILNHVQEGFLGTLWIYIPTVAPYVAKVLGFTNTATNVWVIQLDRSMAGVVAQNMYWVIGDLKLYVCNNDGAAAGVFNGITMNKGDIISNQIQLGFKQGTMDVVSVDATGGSFLVQENR